MDFFETVSTRRSLRHFSDQPVAYEDILAMLEAATLAPSATNEQPRHFIVIRNNELKEGMGDVVSAVLEASISAADDQSRRKHLSRMRVYSIHFASAPVAIAVLARPWVGGGYGYHPDPTSHDLAVESVAMAVAHLLLAASALGYSNCFASAPAVFARKELEAMLSVEHPWFLLGVISLGVAAKPPRKRPPRKAVGQVSTFID